MKKLVIIVFSFIVKYINSQDDNTTATEPYIKLYKKNGVLTATLKNNDQTSFQFFDSIDDQGIVNESFKYSEYGVDIVLVMPAQNIQRINFIFNSACKVPIVYSVQKNNQNAYSLKNSTNMEMYFDQLGQTQLKNSADGSERTLQNIESNNKYVDPYSQQEIIYDIQETSRQIAVVCLFFDPSKSNLLEFQATLQQYSIENQKKDYTMEPEDTQDIDIDIPPQTSYEITIYTEANQLKLTFDYDSSNFEYQVVQIKQDKNIEYKQQTFINVVGIGPQDKIKLLMMNVGNQMIKVNILAETSVVKDSEFPKWAIILISIGGFIILAIIIFLIVLFCRKKKNNNQSRDYPEEPPEFNKEKAKIVKKLSDDEKMDPNMIGSRVHYPQFKEDDQTNIDVFTVKLKEEEMNLDYPSHIVKDNSDNKQF